MYDFTIPTFDETVHPPRQTGIITWRDQTDTDIFERLEELGQVFPDVPEFELTQMHFKQPKELCITGLADPEMVSLIELEAACSKYHTLPYAGGLQDQPLTILEAFSAIREAENEYYAKKFAQTKTEEPTKVIPGLPQRPGMKH